MNNAQIKEIEDLAEKCVLEGCYVCDKAEAASVIMWMINNGYKKCST